MTRRAKASSARSTTWSRPSGSRSRAHDDFYRGEAVARVYALLSSILTTGPYEVLYDVLEQADRSGVAA